MTAWSWVLVVAAVAAAIVTGLMIPGDPASEIARVLFALFLVALIAAGVRSIARSRPHP